MLLIEMMVTIGLLAVVAAIAAPLVGKSIRLTADAETRHNRIVSTEAMVRQLRRDVWGASQVTAIDGGVELRRGNDEIIAWTASGNDVYRTVRHPRRGAVEEPAPDATSHWQTPGLHLALTPAVNGVGVVGRDGQQQVVELFQLQSQVAMLTRRATR